MKKNLLTLQSAQFLYFYDLYGFSAGEGFDRDANAFSFFCLSIVVIIVWVELKQTLFHVLGNNHPWHLVTAVLPQWQAAV